MREFIAANLPMFIGAIIVIAIVLIATVRVMHKRRNFEPGPQEGEASDPQKVKRQNPSDRAPLRR